MCVIATRDTRYPRKVQLQMLTFYLAAQQQGKTPDFFLNFSKHEQEEFLREVERFQQFYGISSDVLLDVLRDFGVEPDEPFVQSVKEIENLQGNRLRSSLREQARRKETVKALNPPLQIIPKSLHPVRLAA